MTTRTERSDTVTDPTLGPDGAVDEIVVLAEDQPTRPQGGGFRLASARVAALLEPSWRQRRTGIAVAMAGGAMWGLIAGQWTPRGPLTTSHAIWSIVLSLAVGGFVGVVSRTRWAALAAPISFAVVFEVVRMGTDGPTVDGVETTTYGLIALVVGRGFHALVSLLPMAYGAALGAGAARRLTPAPSADGRFWRFSRRATAVMAGIGLLAFTIALARPASTEAIVDANGDEIPASIAELATVDIDGHDLTMLIRGHDIANPVLLFLAGGPGGSEMGAMRNHLPELEEHFTVVTWDQRGTGHSYEQLDPAETLTLDNAIDDTIAVTDYLRDRFEQDTIYLLGQSWGTTLGVLAIQEQPELYTAFIGTGQMVSQLATDTIFYEDTLRWAQSTGRAGLVSDLSAIGPPPYGRMLDYETALAHEHDVYPYDHSPNAEGEGGFSENFFVAEYALIDQIHLLGAFMDTFSVLYPQLQDIDFRDTATDFDVPLFFVQGAHEADGRADVFADWYPMIDAPIKDLVVLDTSGHRPLFEQPDEFVDYMTTTVLARTGAGT